MKRLVGRLVLALLALVLVVGCATTGDDAVQQQGGEFTFVSPGGKTRLFYAPADRGRLSDLYGQDLLDPSKQIRLSDFDGRVVVLNVWGSWCGPCRVEAPDLQAVQNKMADQGVTILGINVRDDQSAAADFHQDRGLTYPSIYDPSGRSLLALKNFPRSTVPATIVLDRQHRVAAIYLTSITESELLPEVQKVAGEPAA